MSDADVLAEMKLKLDEVRELIARLVVSSSTLTRNDQAALAVVFDDVERMRANVARVEARAQCAPESHGARRHNAGEIALPLDVDDLAELARRYRGRALCVEDLVAAGERVRSGGGFDIADFIREIGEEGGAPTEQ